MIDQQTIGKILDAAEIVDVVSDYVTLKKRGVNYIGLCPFHNEKTPSFTVSPSKGICKCFGCGAGGTPVNFIMELESMSYPEALKHLARKYNIPVQEKELSEEEKKEKSQIESLRIVSNFANKFFHEQLLNGDEGQVIGKSYFKERGINLETIKKFNLGYCPEKSPTLSESAQKNGYQMPFLEDLGLVKKGQYGHFDFFRGRVIFPIHNLSGHAIAFGGRTLKADKNTAKYFNSPESPLYHKSDVLYGIFQAKKAITHLDKCYLVEGYTDVTSMSQAGIENVVASSGTALTHGQIRLIKRFTQNITIIYDGDAAGIKAALKGIDLVLEQGMNVRVVLLPNGEDPDSFVKSQTKTELLDYLETQEKDFIHFKSELLLNEAQDDPVKRANAIHSVVSSIAKISDSFIRNEFIRSCALIFSIEEATLNSELKKKLNKQIEKLNKLQKNSTSHLPETGSVTQSPSHKPFEKDLDQFGKTYFHTIETAILKYLIKYSELNLFIKVDEHEVKETSVAQYIFNELMIDEINFTNEIYADIFLKAYEHHRNTQTLNQDFFIKHEDPYIAKTCADIIAAKHELSMLFEKQKIRVELEQNKLNELIPNDIIIYKSRSLKKIAKELEQELSQLNDNEPEKERAIFEKLMRVNNALKEMTALINRIIP